MQSKRQNKFTFKDRSGKVHGSGASKKGKPAPERHKQTKTHQNCRDYRDRNLGILASACPVFRTRTARSHLHVWERLSMEKMEVCSFMNNRGFNFMLTNGFTLLRAHKFCMRGTRE